MHVIDWLIVASVFAVCAWIAYRTKRHLHGVTDFLAANRCAGRYLLTLADGMAGLGAIGIIASFQQYYEVGLGAAWWGGIMGPIMLLLPLTGFIIYRFRETRVLTIAEFYEKRYSRNFRIFAGILAFVAGVINYGVFPQVTARFFIYFCGLPQYYIPVGSYNIDVTLGVVMALLLTTALVITFRGGQIAIMVTDFLQAQYMNVVFLVILAALLWKVGLGDLVETLKVAPVEGKSMLNPFDQGNVQSFDMFFYFIMAFNVVYGYMAWQGNQAYNCSARNPHEAKMARILGAWRFGATWTIIALIPLFAYAFLQGGGDGASGANAAVQALGDEGLQKQLTVPLALQQMLPVGVFGLFVAAMLAAAISTDDTYLHSWGSIFIQDVIMPFRKTKPSEQEHLKLLRRSILGVAVFVWFFGMIFPLYEYIFMYWAVTGAIYVGGAGSVIIGGFYWKRGTTAGAWAGMISGSTLAFLGVFINNVFWPLVLPGWRERYPDVAWIQNLPEAFWLDGARIFFYASLVAITAYVVFSLATKPKPGFSMEKLLNRGEYAIAGEHQRCTDKTPKLQTLLGIDDEYTKFDKFIAASVFVWTMFWFTVFIVGCIIGYSTETTEDQWAKYWMFNQGAFILVGIITVVWFLWGGFKDMFEMFRNLNEAKQEVLAEGNEDVLREAAKTEFAVEKERPEEEEITGPRA